MKQELSSTYDHEKEKIETERGNKEILNIFLFKYKLVVQNCIKNDYHECLYIYYVNILHFY